MANDDNHSNIISSGEEAAFKNNMLVVVTLIVAVTFQTGISPPGGAWQDNDHGHEPGKAILARLKIPYHIFLILNTLAFSTSIQIILRLVYDMTTKVTRQVNNKTLYFEVVVATVSMVATYGTAVWSLSPKDDVKLRYVCLSALFPFLLRLSYQIFQTCMCCFRQSSTK